MPAARLALFAPNLSGGGAERTLARLATHWRGQGRDVTLITLAAASRDDFLVPSIVRRIGLDLAADSAGLLSAVRNNLRRVAALREALCDTRPDVIVSFIEQANVLALLAARPLGLPVIISERTDPARHPVSRRWRFLRRRTYPRSAALVVLTDEIAGRMRPIAGGRPVVVIPNGVARPEGVAPKAECRSDRLMLAVGRLGPEKGYDLLLEAAAHVVPGRPAWKLVILGEGPQRPALERQIERSGPKNTSLPGRSANPGAVFASADLFVMASRYEGFPNALLEAMAHGLPAVAFDGPAAVRQVIRHGVDGLLVRDGDTLAFATALGDLMDDAPRRRRMGEAAREVLARFPLDAFFARWDAVVDAAAVGDFSQLSASSSE